MVSTNNKIKKVTGIILIAISILAVIIMAMQALANDIWYDEVFSVAFAKLNTAKLIEMTARDVHPPFYYLFLRLFTLIGGAIMGDGVYIILAKFASLFTWLLLCLIALTYIRKRWGILVAGLFLMLVTMMPQISNYYVEIRMYALALLLIMISGLTAYSIYETAEKVPIYKWIIFFVSGMLTAYTQYYACIGIAGIYIGLFILLIIRKKENYLQALKWLTGLAILSVVLYLPWIPVVFKQFNNINGSYWIQPLSLRSIAGCAKYIYLPVCDKPVLAYLATGLTILVSAVLFCLMIKSNRDQLLELGLIFLSPIIIVILSGFILSAMGTPIFVYRYMIPVLGLYWLFIAIAIDQIIGDRLWGLLIIVPFLLSAILTMRGFYQEEHKKLVQMERVEEAFARLPDGASIITNFDHVAAISGYYLNNDKIYLYEGEIDSILYDMMNGCGEYIDKEGIGRLLDSGEDVYYFGSFNTREEIIADWKLSSIEAYEEDSVLLERYWFNIYRLEKK